MELDATRMSAHQKCPFYHFTIYEEGWVSKVEKVTFSFGTAAHESLKVHYQGGSLEEALKVWETFTPPPNEQLRTREKGVQVITDYFERYESQKFEVLEVEKEFKITIGDNVYFGRKDGVIKWGGLVWVLEHKTSKSLGLSFSEQFRPHNQTYGYCYSCREERGECAGIIYNGLRVAKTKPKDEGGNFARVPVSPIPQEIEDWKLSFTKTCKDIEESRKTGCWEKRHANCFTYYSKCDLYNVCLYGDYGEFKKEEK